MNRNSVEGEGPAGAERPFAPKAIYVEEAARNASLTREILERHPRVPAIPVPSKAATNIQTEQSRPDRRAAGFRL